MNTKQTHTNAFRDKTSEENTAILLPKSKPLALVNSNKISKRIINKNKHELYSFGSWNYFHCILR